MLNLNSNLSIFTVNVNGLKTLKGRDCKDTIEILGRQTIDCEKIFTNYIASKELACRIYTRISQNQTI